MKATALFEMDKKNRQTAIERDNTIKRIHYLHMKSETKNYINSLINGGNKFRLPFEISCWEKSDRGPKLDVSMKELLPVVEEVIAEYADDENELYISSTRHPHECSCDVLYCGHAGCFLIDVRPNSRAKKELKLQD